MASPARTYQKEMHGNVGFFATWLPGDHMVLGAVGVLEGGRFRHEATLADLGIDIEIAISESTQTLKYTSTSGTKVQTSAGATVPVAKAQISIEFSAEGAFVFDAQNVQQSRIANRFAIAEQILVEYRRGHWSRDWYVVESLQSAESATIIVAQDRSAGVVLDAHTELPIPSTALSDPRVSLSVSSSHGKVLQILGGRDLKPLYSCLRVRDPLFGDPEIAAVRGANEPGDSMQRFAVAGIDELLDS